MREAGRPCSSFCAVCAPLRPVARASPASSPPLPMFENSWGAMASSSVLDLQKVELAKGRLGIFVSPEIESEHGVRLTRIDEVAALGGYLRSRLCGDGFWPRDRELTITLGERQSPVADDSHFAVTLPGYSSAWSGKKFEDGVCVAARRFLRLVAPRAPAGRYLADFERGGRIFSWSYLAESKKGVVARLGCALSRTRFKAWLSVTTESGRTSRFKVFESGPGHFRLVRSIRKVARLERRGCDRSSPQGVREGGSRGTGACGLDGHRAPSCGGRSTSRCGGATEGDDGQGRQLGALVRRGRTGHTD